MSFCKIVPAALGLPTTIERQVSSANELILDWISSTISLMQTKKNSRGPRIEPCGTPAHTCFGSEITPGITTHYFLLNT